MLLSTPTSEEYVINMIFVPNYVFSISATSTI